MEDRKDVVTDEGAPPKRRRRKRRRARLSMAESSMLFRKLNLARITNRVGSIPKNVGIGMDWESIQN